MQEFYLSHMDIQIWSQRRILPGAKQVMSGMHAVLFKSQQAVGDLIMTPWDNEEKVNKLLSAMLVAIKLELGKINFINDFNHYDISGNSPILVLGDVDKNIKSLQNRPIVFSFHPAHLLRHPSDKAIAWQHLKVFSSLLNN